VNTLITNRLEIDEVSTQQEALETREIEMRDDLPHHEREGPPPVVLPRAKPTPPEDAPSESRSRVLEGLLRMADTYQSSGGLHQAIEMYFELLREHDDTVQARSAEARLLDIALRYEQNGEPRQARSIYEQLL
jgi:hypothetical protein